MFTVFSGEIYISLNTHTHTGQGLEMSLVQADLELIYCLLFFGMHAGRYHWFMTSFQYKRLFLLFSLDFKMSIHLFSLYLPAEILKHRALQG